MLKKMLADKRIRFILVGAVNTAFSYLLYALFVALGVRASLATILMYPPGILVSYLANKRFTFRVRQRSWMEFLRFIAVYAVSFAVNYCTVLVLTDIFKWNAYLAGLFGLASATLASYTGHSLFSFRQPSAETMPSDSETEESTK